MQKSLSVLNGAERTYHPASASRLSVFQVMARKLYFGPSRATSIDLCVHDLVAASRFRANTTIFAEECDDLFPHFSVERLPRSTSAVTAARAGHVARVASSLRPDVIIVQQHLPTAAAIARLLPHAKIILHRHNFPKSYRSRSPILGFFSRLIAGRRYSRFAGFIHVSQACADAFAADWPEITTPSCVVNNGLDFDAWKPTRERANVVLCVGRCAPEKGILEAAQAVAATLPNFPEWRARFILSNITDHPVYAQQVRSVLSGLGARATLEEQRPFVEIKAATELAAIALVPSKWTEPFGRTALEAHAGGAALISSGRGGLAEVSGVTALMLPDVTAEAIATAIQTLISNETLRNQLADKAMVRARENFDIRVQAANMDAFCLAVASGTSTAGSTPPRTPIASEVSGVGTASMQVNEGNTHRRWG